MVVSKNPHHVLTSLYGKTLRALAKMPANAVYRQHTEKIVSERAGIVAQVISIDEWSKQPYIRQKKNLIAAQTKSSAKRFPIGVFFLEYVNWHVSNTEDIYLLAQGSTL